jgi:hypothetical protein
MIRPSTLVILQNLLQNRIFPPYHQYSLLHIYFYRTHLPLYLNSISATSGGTHLSLSPPLFPTRSRAPLLFLSPSPSHLLLPDFSAAGAGWGRRRRARPPPDPSSGADPLPPARIPARGSMAGRRRATTRQRGRRGRKTGRRLRGKLLLLLELRQRGSRGDRPPSDSSSARASPSPRGGGGGSGGRRRMAEVRPWPVRMEVQRVDVAGTRLRRGEGVEARVGDDERRCGSSSPARRQGEFVGVRRVCLSSSLRAVLLSPARRSFSAGDHVVQADAAAGGRAGGCEAQLLRRRPSHAKSLGGSRRVAPPPPGGSPPSRRIWREREPPAVFPFTCRMPLQGAFLHFFPPGTFYSP